MYSAAQTPSRGRPSAVDRSPREELRARGCLWRVVFRWRAALYVPEVSERSAERAPQSIAWCGATRGAREMQQAAVPKIAEITLALRELARLRHLRRPIRERLARLVRIRQQLLLTLHSLPLLLVRDGSAHEQAGRDQPAADELDWRGDLAEGGLREW